MIASYLALFSCVDEKKEPGEHCLCMRQIFNNYSHRQDVDVAMSLQDDVELRIHVLQT